MKLSKSLLRQDATAALINAVVSVPDGLASAALAGVNPVFGLYTSIAGPIGGSLLASTQLMQVATTSASALTAAQAISGYPEAQRAQAMFLLVLLTGVCLAMFGLLRVGRLVRYISHAVMTGFLSGVAAVVAVQGAGVSQIVENPDGSRANPSRDMLAEGVANVASGLLSGIPAGGSVGQTALNVSVGARSRWAGVLAGVWMLVIVLLVPTLVGRVPMAVLAALMIIAGLSALDFDEARSIWETGGTARWSILASFTATLILSVPVAVAVGVGLSVVLTMASAASDVKVYEVIRLGDGRFAQSDPPARLPSDEVTVLEVVGSLFFAGARTLGEALPSPVGATRPAVVLRLRGRTNVGSTLIEVIDDYADDLAEVGGRLYLSGVDERLAAQLRRAGKLDLERAVELVPAHNVYGESTTKAVDDARAWLGSTRGSA